LYILSIILSVTQALQFFSFGFEKNHTWGKASSWIQYISVLRTVGAGLYNYSTHIALFGIFMTYLILFVLIGSLPYFIKLIYLAVLVFYRQKYDKTTDPRIIYTLQIMHHIFLPLVYLPLLYIFGYVLVCSNGSLVIDQSIGCWNSQNISAAVFAIFGIGIAVIIAAASSFM
jgi:hypothetical protein